MFPLLVSCLYALILVLVVISFSYECFMRFYLNFCCIFKPVLLFYSFITVTNISRQSLRFAWFHFL